MSAKKVRKQVSGCLHNLYQSVAIHLKYVLFGTLIMFTKVFSSYNLQNSLTKRSFT